MDLSSPAQEQAQAIHPYHSWLTTLRGKFSAKSYDFVLYTPAGEMTLKTVTTNREHGYATLTSKDGKVYVCAQDALFSLFLEVRAKSSAVSKAKVVGFEAPGPSEYQSKL